MTYWTEAWIGFAVLIGAGALFVGFIVLVIAAVGLWERWKCWREEPKERSQDAKSNQSDSV